MVIWRILLSVRWGSAGNRGYSGSGGNLRSSSDSQEGVELIKSYQKQGILVTLVGGIIDQARDLGLKMGYNVRIVPLGYDVTSVIHVVSVALRAALIFGNVQPGDAGALIEYTSQRVPAFVNAFKPVDDVILAAGAGAIKLGFPVISNEDEILWKCRERDCGIRGFEF